MAIGTDFVKIFLSRLKLSRNLFGGLGGAGGDKKDKK
jgi:hypothetical protein